MSRPKGIKEAAPRKRGGGRKKDDTYAARFAADETSESVIRLPNRFLCWIEGLADEKGLTVREFLTRAEIYSRIL